MQEIQHANQTESKRAENSNDGGGSNLIDLVDVTSSPDDSPSVHDISMTDVRPEDSDSPMEDVTARVQDSPESATEEKNEVEEPDGNDDEAIEVCVLFVFQEVVFGFLVSCSEATWTAVVVPTSRSVSGAAKVG